MLLQNAIDAIRVGVEDYLEGSRPRLLSAVRNVYAGILLLHKEVLLQMCPPGSNEVLLKSRIVPQRDSAGNLVFIGQGNSIDVDQIKSRFKKLGLDRDWSALEKLRDTRNDVEHYYTAVNQETLAATIANAMTVIRRVVSVDLEESPLDLFGAETWQRLLVVEQVYEEERKACLEALLAVDWESDVLQEGLVNLTCPACGSDLLTPGSSTAPVVEQMVTCRACGESTEACDFIPLAVKRFLGAELYSSVKDGGEIPYTDCPECLQSTYIVQEHRCVHCGHEAREDCILCGARIPPEELMSSPYCGWHEHMLSKDD